MANHKIIDQGDLRKYRIEIPNLVDDMHLSPFAFRLYVHIKRVAGANNESACFQSTKTIARICNMSEGMVSKAKNELETAELINIDYKKNENGGKDYHYITIIDVWRKNFEAFSNEKFRASSQDELDGQTNSQNELASSCDEFTSSPHELKNKHIKNNINSSCDELPSEKTIKKNNHDILKPETDGGYYLFNILGEIQREKSRRPPEKFQNSVQKRTFEAEEIRLGYSELIKAINHFISKGITARGEIITRLKNWSVEPLTRNKGPKTNSTNNKNYDQSRSAEYLQTMNDIDLEKQRTQEKIQAALEKRTQNLTDIKEI